MQYYEYTPDCTIAGVGTDPPIRGRLGDIYRWDAPLASLWSPVVFFEFNEDPSERGDFPSLHDCPALPVFSQRAWDVLRRVIDCRWEALPIIHPSGRPFYIIHVMETIDCLDVEHSEGVKRYDDGDVMDVERYSFRTEMLAGKHIFKLSLQTMGRLLVDDVFREAVERNGLKGLEFRALPTVER